MREVRLDQDRLLVELGRVFYAGREVEHGPRTERCPALVVSSVPEPEITWTNCSKLWLCGGALVPAGTTSRASPKPSPWITRRSTPAGEKAALAWSGPLTVDESRRFD
ncbi:hypothetical protein [Methylobacterium brachythecii]|uniref:Uncharacterized protein n=1 Tax=Methylobacterium brachythecii TaxID=1176177 RepID=A0A7W6ADM0_9HYPH|nr:hypothetical protein [Methylobacterium brachythecii]MBB3901330.1 hypothetical protein [Methylobacterium brachythecii]GLS42904.1 hypothetical protein GCM10007884_08890 [Methylobacterium brachythecii]